MKINASRLSARLQELAGCGRTPEDGVTRVSYSAAYRQGMDLVISWMKQAGMDVSVDGAGNILGLLKGSDPLLPVVATGSHLDTVPNGGRFDGALGVTAAIECAQTWKEYGFRPPRGLLAVATVEEEGNLFGMCFGTRAMTGQFASTPASDLVSLHQEPLSECLARIGLDPGRFGPPSLHPAGIACFVELHVEQGEELACSGLTCGVVTGVVGIDRRWLTLEGRENHAGTTRMDRRQDALAAAARFISSVRRHALEAGGGCTCTVGSITVHPGAVNIIPGKATLSFEARYVGPDDHADVSALLDSIPVELHSEYGVSSSWRPITHTPPVLFDPTLGQVLWDAAVQLGVSCRRMPSWAGHDAQFFAPLTPTAMLFVSSIGGISHSPAESTLPEDAAAGVNVLNRALMRLARAAE